jgi:hypothetical protein
MFLGALPFLDQFLEPLSAHPARLFSAHRTVSFMAFVSHSVTSAEREERDSYHRRRVGKKIRIDYCDGYWEPDRTYREKELRDRNPNALSLLLQYLQRVLRSDCIAG